MHFRFLSAFFLLLLLTANIYAQKIDEKFERKIQEFKYSLYPLLKEIELNTNLDFSNEKLNCPPSLISEIDDFIEKNSSKIYKLQRAYLLKHENTRIDTNTFQKDSNLVHALEKGYKKECEEFRNSFTACGKGLLTISYINPIYYAHYLKMMFQIYLDESIAEKGLKFAKDLIAAPKIKTEEITKDRWMIFFDHYFYLHKFTYWHNEGKMELSATYTRNNQ